MENFEELDERIIKSDFVKGCLKNMAQIAKHYRCSDFRIDAFERRPFVKLLVYFLKEKGMASKYGLDLNKGIALIGPIGCGKTTLMRIFSQFQHREDSRFIVKSTRDIVNEYAELGRIIIQRYSRDLNAGYTNRGTFSSRNYCFDDVGIEAPTKYFGEEVDIMEEILSSRYDMQNTITHITSNLSPKDLGKRYGERLASRMREMFNVVAFAADIPDKRK